MVCLLARLEIVERKLQVRASWALLAAGVTSRLWSTRLPVIEVNAKRKRRARTPYKRQAACLKWI